MRNTLLLIVIPLMFAFDGRAEIKSKKLLKNLFNGCINEEIEGFSLGGHFEYCACFTKQISFSMTVEEIMFLEMDMRASTSKREQERIAASNQKFKRAVAKCAAKFYE